MPLRIGDCSNIRRLTTLPEAAAFSGLWIRTIAAEKRNPDYVPLFGFIPGIGLAFETRELPD
jgi:hypothetical protein